MTVFRADRPVRLVLDFLVIGTYVPGWRRPTQFLVL
jgi:hypothetical protein